MDKVKNMLERYNTLLKEKYGANITVELKSYTEDDNSTWFYWDSARCDSDACETVEEAYRNACAYLDRVGEW